MLDEHHVRAAGRVLGPPQSCHFFRRAELNRERAAHRLERVDDAAHLPVQRHDDGGREPGGGLVGGETGHRFAEAAGARVGPALRREVDDVDRLAVVGFEDGLARSATHAHSGAVALASWRLRGPVADAGSSSHRDLGR